MHGTMFRVRVRGRSAAMHLMVHIVVAMSCPVAPMSGLKTDGIAILVTCKLGSLVLSIIRRTESLQVMIRDAHALEGTIYSKTAERRRVQCTCQCIVGMQMTERSGSGKHMWSKPSGSPTGPAVPMWPMWMHG